MEILDDSKQIIWLMDLVAIFDLASFDYNYLSLLLETINYLMQVWLIHSSFPDIARIAKSLYMVETTFK